MSSSEPPQLPQTPTRSAIQKFKKKAKPVSRTVTSPYFKRCRHKTSDVVASSIAKSTRPRTHARTRNEKSTSENDEHSENLIRLAGSNLVSFQPDGMNDDTIRAMDLLVAAHDANMNVSNLPTSGILDVNFASENTDPIDSIVISGSDVEWYKRELDQLKDPLFSYYLRKYTQLYTSLWQAKPLLIQERVASDPWKLLVAVMFLNKTAGKVAIPIFWDILNKWPTPELMSEADVKQLKLMITRLGLQDTRARRLIAMSRAFISDPPRSDLLRKSAAYLVPVKDELTGQLTRIAKQRYPPTAISHLPGTGPYAMDSYRIFCLPGDEWKSVMPADKELIRFMRWKWAFHEQQRWDPIKGVIGEIQVDEIEALPALLAV